ncbi:MAG: hypothetical protein GY757_00025 [bacterium]|nr:hypothetical protein [bacterium]
MKEKKIAILLENRFIDQEIIYYSHRFSEERIKLEFLTRLWGQPSLTFKGLELGMEKSVDMSFEGMSDKQMEEYVAIIVPAGKNSAFCGLHYKRGSKGSLPLALGEPSATPRRAAGGIFLFLWNFSLLNFVLKPDKKTEAKMRKILFMVVIFFLACFFLAGKQVATFSDVVKPELIQAKNDKLYVLQRTSICM